MFLLALSSVSFEPVHVAFFSLAAGGLHHFHQLGCNLLLLLRHCRRHHRWRVYSKQHIWNLLLVLLGFGCKFLHAYSTASWSFVIQFLLLSQFWESASVINLCGYNQTAVLSHTAKWMRLSAPVTTSILLQSSHWTFEATFWSVSVLVLIHVH